MFGFLVEQSLRNRLFVLVAAAVLIVYGGLSLKTLQVDVFPDLNKPTITLLTEAEGLAPEEVELLVSFPIETAMNGMPGVTRVRSVAAVGLSIVFVEFDWGTDIQRNRQQVSERLNTIVSHLPDGVTPQMAPVSSIMGEIMLIALSSTSTTSGAPGAAAAPGPSSAVSAMELREAADWIVRPRLLAIPGVSQVIPIGGEVRQYRVTPNIALMVDLGIGLEDVLDAINAFGENTGGGYVEQGGREFLIRNIGRTARLEDLRNLIVAYRDEQPVFLRQVAEVDFAAGVKRGDAGFMGHQAVILSVQKQPHTDTVKLTREIEAALSDLAKVMPPGVQVEDVLFKQADFIDASVGNVKQVLIEAMAVVAAVLFLFLLNVRTTAISLVAIPISILITIVVFRHFGLSINTMTLGGLAIAIGELVDDAVVDVENIFRRLRENQRRAQPAPVLDVIINASKEVRSGIIYATLIIVLVFVPLFALSGIEGRLFSPLGVAYIVSILASLLTSITLTPVLSYYLLTRLKLGEVRDSFLVRGLKRVNERALSWAFDRQAFVYVVAVTAVIAAGVAATMLPRSFLPPFNEGTLTISLQFSPGISLSESNRMGAVAERLILNVPEVEKVGRRTGRAELDEHAEGVHSSEIDVDLTPSDRSKEQILSDIRDRLAVIPANVNIGQPISHRLDHLLSGVRAQIALKIFGDDLDTLRVLAEDTRARLSAIPGLVDLQVEKQVLIPQLRVAIDYELTAIYGINPTQVTEAVARLSGGQVVSQVIDGSRRFDVVLRLADQDRVTSGLANLVIETPAGSVPLSTFARVVETDGPNQVLRENGRRRIVVLANIAGADTAEVVARIRAELAQTSLPPGYFTSLEGTFQAQEQAARLIALLSLVSLALIFAVLYSRYRSVPLAFLIMGNIPLALVGSVCALWIAGQPLSVASMIGFVTLTGITARNGILKVSHYINLVLHEGEAFGRRMIVRGSLERLSPVLMTAFSAGFALVPLLLGAGEPGKEILHPVAVVIFGGLVSATLLDALVTPLLFLKFGAPAIARLRDQSSGMKPAEAY